MGFEMAYVRLGTCNFKISYCRNSVRARVIERKLIIPPPEISKSRGIAIAVLGAHIICCESRTSSQESRGSS